MRHKASRRRAIPILDTQEDVANFLPDAKEERVVLGYALSLVSLFIWMCQDFTASPNLRRWYQENKSNKSTIFGGSTLQCWLRVTLKVFPLPQQPVNFQSPCRTLRSSMAISDIKYQQTMPMVLKNSLTAFLLNSNRSRSQSYTHRVIIQVQVQVQQQQYLRDSGATV